MRRAKQPLRPTEASGRLTVPSSAWYGSSEQGLRGHLTASCACATMAAGFGWEWMRMRRNDSTQRCRRLKIVQPMRSAAILPPPLPPPCTNFQNREAEKQLSAPADRPVRDPAHAVAFTTAVAIGGVGSVHRRTGMRTAPALPGDRNRPGSPRGTDSRQDPPTALPAIQTRCFAAHCPAWRCDAGPDVGRAVGVCVMGHTRIPTGSRDASRYRRPGCGLPPASSRLDTRPARTPVNASAPPSRAAAHDSGPPWVATTTLPVLPALQEVQMILKEPYARAA